MPKLPETGFLRLKQIIGDPKANPPIPPLIPISKSTWWAGVKAGIYPQSVKLGQRITAWRVEDNTGNTSNLTSLHYKSNIYGARGCPEWQFPLS